MASNGGTIHYTVQLDAQIKGFQSTLVKLQQELNKIKLPDVQSKQLTEGINKVLGDLTKFQELANQPITNANEMKKYISLLSKIEGGFNGVVKTISELSGVSQKELKTLLPKELLTNLKKMEQATQKWGKTYTENIGKVARAQEELAKAEKEEQKLREKRDDLAKKGYTAESIKGKSAGPKQIADTKAAIEQKKIELAQAKQERTVARRQNTTQGTAETAATLKEKEAAYESLDAEVKELTKDLEKMENIRALRDLLPQLKAAENNTSKLRKVFDDLSKTTDFESFKNSLKELNANVGIDMSKINSWEELEQAIKSTGEEAVANFQQGIQSVIPTLNQATAAGDDFANGVKRENEEVNRLAKSTSELASLKNRILQFFGITGTIQIFRRSIRQAYEAISELDKVMTETAVVTDFTVSDMWEQLPKYTKQANELGVATSAAYEAATLYYQQGLKTQQVEALSVETLKMARIAGLDAADATDRMTNALRGFNMELNQASAQRVADVYSELAAVSATDVDELSTAMTKVASIASSAGMEFENVSAFLSQILETTREAPETAGTALKTVIARFSEVKKLYSEDELTGQDEEGEIINVNKVQAALQTAGIDMSKFFLGEEGLDQVFLELAKKWDSLTTVQQRYIATQAAGSRQQSRFIALMSDYDRLVELVGDAYDASGASQEQYEKTLDSLESKTQKMQNAWNQFTMTLMNSDALKAGVDILTKLLNLVNDITSSFGTLGGAIVSLAGIFSAMQLGKGLLTGALDLGGISNAFSKVFGGMKVAGAKAGKETGKAVTNGIKQEVDKGSTQFKYSLNKALSLKKFNFSKEQGLDIANQIEDQLSKVPGAKIGDTEAQEYLKGFRQRISADGANVRQEIENMLEEPSDANPEALLIDTTESEIRLAQFQQKMHGVGVAAGVTAGACAAVVGILDKIGESSDKINPKLETTKSVFTGLASGASAVSGMALGISSLTTSLAGASGAAKAFGAALSTAAPYLIGITAIIGVVGAITGAYKAHQKAVEEAHDQAIAKAEDEKTKLNELKEKIDEVSKAYKDLGENGLDESNINKIRQLAEELGIVGRNALIAAGDYETLIEKIKEERIERLKKDTEKGGEFYEAAEEGKKALVRAGNAPVLPNGSKMSYTGDVSFSGQFFEVEKGPEGYYSSGTIKEKGKVETVEDARKKYEEALELLPQIDETDALYDYLKSYIEEYEAALDENIDAIRLQTNGSIEIAENENKLALEEEDSFKDAIAKRHKLAEESGQTKSDINEYYSSQGGAAGVLGDQLAVYDKIRDNNNFDVNSWTLTNFQNAINGIIDSGFGALLNNTDFTNQKFDSVEDFRAKAAQAIAEQYQSIKETSAESEFAEDEEKGKQLGATRDYLIQDQQNDITEEMRGTASEIAADNIHFNEGLKEIIDSYDQWSGLIDANTGKLTAESAEEALVIDNLKASMNKLIGSTADLSDEFYENANNINLMKRAAEGDMDALQELQKEATKDIILHMGLDEENQTEVSSAVSDFVNSLDYEDLKLGTSIDQSGAINGLNDLLSEGAITVDQMNEILSGIGWTPDITYAEMPLSEAQAFTQSQEAEVLIPDGKGGYKRQTIRTANRGGISGETMVRVPVFGSAQISKAKNAGHKLGVMAHFSGTPSSSNVEGANKNAGSGGGGGGGKDSTWKSDYDWLYNLEQHITEELRKQKQLEADLKDLAEDPNASGAEKLKNLQEQVKVLEAQKKYYDIEQARRADEMRAYEKEYKDVSQYVWFDWEHNAVHENTDKIDAIQDEDTYKRVEEAKKELERIEKEMEEAGEKAEDIDDQIREIQKKFHKDFIDLQNRVMDALKQSYQDEIDALSNVSNAIDKANDKLVDGINKALSKQRQNRENKKTEKNLTDIEQRIAYLSMDTSGANQKEIMDLQAQLDDERQSYTDTLIDQKVNELKDQNDQASAERQAQIDLMQAQLNYAVQNGTLWQEVYELMQKGINDNGILIENSRMTTLLKNKENWTSLSAQQKTDWANDLKTQASNAYVEMQGVKTNTGEAAIAEKTAQKEIGTKIVPATKEAGEKSSGSGGSGSVRAGIDNTGDKIEKQLKDYSKVTPITTKLDDLKRAIDSKATNVHIQVGGSAKSGTYLTKYATGGLADETGPAWLDGTKSRPEYILNAAQTKGFLTLVDVLEGLKKGDYSNTNNNSTYGDFNLNINVDKMSDDFDTDNLIKKIKKELFEDASYRNFNNVTRLR